MDAEIIDLIRAVAVGFQGQMQETVQATSDLTVFQARLVSLIGRNEGVSQLELAASLDRDKAQVARAVKQLEAKGLVVKSPDPSSWRNKCLTLTDSGRLAFTGLKGARDRLASRALAEFSEADKLQLKLALMRLVP